MIGRTARLQVLAFVLVSVLGVGYVAVRYVGVGDRLLGGSYVVHMDLTRAGGIFPNAPVTYRGVPVGKVTAVALHGDGVRADLRLQRDVRVPDDLRAVVAQRSAVGEQYVDLRPDRDGGPYLADGAVIPADRTGVPLAPEVLLTNLDALVRSVDPEDLTVLITELGTAFEGNETALASILDAGDALLTEADARLPETLALIDDGRTVLTTQAESAEALRRWAAGLAQLAATLREADPDLRRLLAAGPPAGRELSALLRGLEPTVGTLLGNLVTVNGIAARRLPGIEQMLVVYPIAVAGGFTVTPGDGTVHLGLVVNANDPPSCVYGGGNAKCDAGERAAGASVRGNANAPRPGGREPAADPASSGAAPRAGTTTGGYDPATGLVLGADGRPLQFGGTGGQSRMAGDQSWKQLLLAGVTP
ncbi:MCE family protein [Micromonospora purpureochromogenes]|uniref:MCE family protein n=1 Tax=Micromonospora purpureochromogenes TaxID=47872 RepID=UPI0033DE09F1